MKLEARLPTETCTVLKAVRSPNQPTGFHSVESLKTFVKNKGIMGFHNIREITPTMVDEIKIAIQ